MSKVLVIFAHPHTSEKSLSLTIGKKFLNSYQAAHPADELIERDIYAEAVPGYENETLAIFEKLGRKEELTAAEQARLAKQGVYLDEFIGADKYVFINPMYNYSLPAELKAYIDVLTVPRKTFRYTETGPIGLLSGKKALHIQAAGGYYHGKNAEGNELADLGSAYWEQMMTLYGITDLGALYIEGARNFPDRAESIEKAALAEAEQLGKEF